MRTVSVFLALLVGASATDKTKCYLGDKVKYTSRSGAAVSLLSAGASWGDEGVEGLKELHTMESVDNVVSTQPSMIMFYAEWCPHCKRMKPIFIQAAQNAAEMGINFYMVNADVNRQVGAAYGVDGFPTVKFFHGMGPDHSGVEYDGGENLPAAKIESFAKAELAKAKAAFSAGTLLVSTKAEAAPEAAQADNAAAVDASTPAKCDGSACENFQCPEGWQTGVNSACQCRCNKQAGAKAAKIRAKAAKARAAARAAEN